MRILVTVSGKSRVVSCAGKSSTVGGALKDDKCRAVEIWDPQFGVYVPATAETPLADGARLRLGGGKTSALTRELLGIRGSGGRCKLEPDDFLLRVNARARVRPWSDLGDIRVSVRATADARFSALDLCTDALIYAPAAARDRERLALQLTSLNRKNVVGHWAIGPDSREVMFAARLCAGPGMIDTYISTISQEAVLVYGLVLGFAPPRGKIDIADGADRQWPPDPSLAVAIGSPDPTFEFHCNFGFPAGRDCGTHALYDAGREACGQFGPFRHGMVACLVDVDRAPKTLVIIGVAPGGNDSESARLAAWWPRDRGASLLENGQRLVPTRSFAALRGAAPPECQTLGKHDPGNAQP